MASGEQIQAALRAFVAKWEPYTGSERAEAQTFLNELFACYGSDRQAVGARFEDFKSSAGFMDLHWPGVCIVEMKAPARDVMIAREQVRRYWEESSDLDKGIQAARWVVICTFPAFRDLGARPVSQPASRFPHPRRAPGPVRRPRLPRRAKRRAFVRRASPRADDSSRAKIAQLYRSLADRVAAPADEIQRFVMQAVWCLFAEDFRMLEGWPLQGTEQRLIAEPTRSSAAEIGLLFRVLNQKSGHNRTGLLAGTTYVNGQLFQQPADVDLNQDELHLLLEASQFDWRKVDPTIFGALLEGVLGHDRRWELGMHYTHEVDIMKIVTPTVIRPWRERIEAAPSPQAARELLDELCAFRVLDPACGCGNFLYVVYRELRGLEHELKERIRSLAREHRHPLPAEPWPYYPLTNLLGIDIDRAAVAIARVTLWMGHRQMIERYGPAEDPLPSWTSPASKSPTRYPSPGREAECIIGNPPFLGSQWIRGARGDDYVKWLSREYGVGVKDFCVYWFRRAVDHLQPGQRAGLVGTNSVAQNRARSAALDYVVERGGVITDAVKSQKWPGEAKVHVSLVNWVDEPPTPPTQYVLDGRPVVGIGADLTESLHGAWQPVRLPANAGRCLQGPIPVGAGFILSEVEAKGLLAQDDADYRDVVRPYLTGEDIAQAPDQGPRRWIIDFGSMPLEQAARYPGGTGRPAGAREARAGAQCPACPPAAMVVVR